MTRIVLQNPREPSRYRAVIGKNAMGWAYPLSQHRDGPKVVMDAMVELDGKPGTATYEFTFDGAHWTTNSEPIENTDDWVEPG